MTSERVERKAVPIAGTIPDEQGSPVIEPLDQTVGSGRAEQRWFA
jgi:hypothetical protein